MPPHATQALEINSISPITNLTEVAKKEKEEADARAALWAKHAAIEGHINNPDVITINIDKITAYSRSNVSNKVYDQIGSVGVSRPISNLVSGRLHAEDSVQLNSVRSHNMSKITQKP